MTPLRTRVDVFELLANLLQSSHAGFQPGGARISLARRAGDAFAFLVLFGSRPFVVVSTVVPLFISLHILPERVWIIAESMSEGEIRVGDPIASSKSYIRTATCVTLMGMSKIAAVAISLNAETISNVRL